jgi:hypothetical protein
MSKCPEHARLRVVTDKVQLSNVSVPVPKGEYDGYIDWHSGMDGKRYMTAVQLMIDRDALAQMGRSKAIASMQCEVLRYLRHGDIEQV